ncbi:hypothetical protein VN97_g10866 [Penicillium thymicola]|uniref:Uncharacterized protein n=1 Tax=Penicillium thymicola TaxID=293382 RepID=A0AAI9T863_PENTH|nr:hypothetical protein VN97_g10866 [Penicillium thymicola]
MGSEYNDENLVSGGAHKQPERLLGAWHGYNRISIRNRLNNKKQNHTYNSEDSLVVTHPTTNSPACGLSTAERTGSPVFHTLWSYVRG